MNESKVLTQQDGHVVTVTLNVPERLNAFDREMTAELGELWPRLAADPQVRSVVITGTGRGFCAGAHVGRLADAAERPLSQQPVTYPRFTNRHCRFFKPVIAAVNGVCAGAGLHFVADADIVVAAESAKFVDTHVEVGQVTALEPVGLLRKIAAEHVLRMVVLGRAGSVSASEAARIGLVGEVLPDDELMDRAWELARIAASVSPETVQRSLQAVWESFELPLSEAYDRGYELVVAHRGHPDALEGARAFMEKREPKWTVTDVGGSQDG